MNKNQFLYELRTKLKNLPAAEVELAMNYYEEYFLDAGSENEQKAIEELGSPAAVASKIVGEFALSDSPSAPKSSARTLWVVILALLASPIALPLVLAIVITVFALLVALFATVLSVGVAGIAVVVAGVVTVLAGFWALFVDFGTGVFNIGSGLFAIGVGVLLTMGITILARLCIKGLQKMLGALLVRKVA